jgi:3-hydroxymyristoyl/3-hydroxydecanoyl-(acyl carrier protein) dehydratase
MKEKNLDLALIKKSIPHRFENLLIDSCKFSEEGDAIEGVLQIKIAPGDKLGRDAFTKEKTKDVRTVLEAFFMEILALGSIVSTGQIPKGSLALFAGVSDFKKMGDMLVGEQVTGRVKKIRAKGAFLKYAGALYNEQNEMIASGNMMAFYAKVSDLTGNDVGSKEQVREPGVPVSLNKEGLYKAPEMFLVDALVEIDPDSLALCCKYTYPKDYFLVKGHFPGNPIMMGVMQWMAMADAGYVLAQYLAEKGRVGRYQIKADAKVLKENGAVAAEAKGILLQVYKNDNEYLDQVEIIETKKLLFKDMIKPGETVYIKFIPLAFV